MSLGNAVNNPDAMEAVIPARDTVDRRLRLVAIVLAVVGLGIATYLTIIHYEDAAPLCAIGGDCEKVQTSEWATFLGVPVALLGALGYLGILIALFLPGELGLVSSCGLALIGFGFSAYLTYREIFTINAICTWCVASAILLTLLAIITTVRLLRT